MSTNRSVTATAPHCPTITIHDDPSCPSLVSSVSTRRSRSAEKTSTKHDPRLTLEDQSKQPLRILDRDYVWARWEEGERNPIRVFCLEVKRDLHGRQLSSFGDPVAFHFGLLFPQPLISTERFCPASSEGDQESEPIDSDGSRNQAGREQTPSKRRKTSGAPSRRHALSDDITDPKGPEEEEEEEGKLRLGFGIYNARKENWRFKCYWFKSLPVKHSACTDSDFERERSVRTSHPKWHLKKGHVTLDIYNRLADLPRAVAPNLANLRGRDRDMAMWREGFVVVFPGYRALKEHLNPTIGPLLPNFQRDSTLVQAGNWPTEAGFDLQPGTRFPMSQGDVTAPPPGPALAMNLTDLGVPDSLVAQGLSAPSFGGELIPTNASQPPPVPTFHASVFTGPAPPWALMQIDPQILAAPTPSAQLTEPVELALETFSAMSALPLWADPQLTPMATNPSFSIAPAQQMQSLGLGLPLHPPPGGHPTPQMLDRSQRSGPRSSSSRLLDTAPHGTSSRVANRVLATFPRTASPHLDLRSLTTDSGHLSSLASPGTSSEPLTPPRLEATNFRREASQPGTGPIDPGSQEELSPDILSYPFKTPNAGNVMFGSPP